MRNENENNRIDDVNSPEVLAIINDSIRKNVQELSEQLVAAVKAHPEEMAAASLKFRK
jgi:hypothetical protein